MAEFYLFKFHGGPRDGQVWPWEDRIPIQLCVYAPQEMSPELVNLEPGEACWPYWHDLYHYHCRKPDRPDGFVHYWLM